MIGACIKVLKNYLEKKNTPKSDQEQLKNLTKTIRSTKNPYKYDLEH